MKPTVKNWHLIVMTGVDADAIPSNLNHVFSFLRSSVFLIFINIFFIQNTNKFYKVSTDVVPMSDVHEHLYRPLKQHQPNNSYHHKNNSQNTDANEDDIAQVMRLNFGVPRAALTVFVSLPSLLLQTALLRRNDGHRRDLPQGVTLHLVLLHVLLLPVREINVELVYQHSDVLMFLQGDVRSQGLQLS